MDLYELFGLMQVEITQSVVITLFGERIFIIKTRSINANWGDDIDKLTGKLRGVNSHGELNIKVTQFDPTRHCLPIFGITTVFQPIAPNAMYDKSLVAQSYKNQTTNNNNDNNSNNNNNDNANNNPQSKQDIIRIQQQHLAGIKWDDRRRFNPEDVVSLIIFLKNWFNQHIELVGKHNEANLIRKAAQGAFHGNVYTKWDNYSKYFTKLTLETMINFLDTHYPQKIELRSTFRVANALMWRNSCYPPDILNEMWHNILKHNANLDRLKTHSLSQRFEKIAYTLIPRELWRRVFDACRVAALGKGPHVVKPARREEYKKYVEKLAQYVNKDWSQVKPEQITQEMIIQARECFTRQSQDDVNYVDWRKDADNKHQLKIEKHKLKIDDNKRPKPTHKSNKSNPKNNNDDRAKYRRDKSRQRKRTRDNSGTRSDPIVITKDTPPPKRHISSMICHKCGYRGHRHSQCTQRVFCGYCKKMGKTYDNHNESMCYHKVAADNNNNNDNNKDKNNNNNRGNKDNKRGGFKGNKSKHIPRKKCVTFSLSQKQSDNKSEKLTQSENNKINNCIGNKQQSSHYHRKQKRRKRKRKMLKKHPYLNELFMFNFKSLINNNKKRKIHSHNPTSDTLTSEDEDMIWNDGDEEVREKLKLSFSTPKGPTKRPTPKPNKFDCIDILNWKNDHKYKNINNNNQFYNLNKTEQLFVKETVETAIIDVSTIHAPKIEIELECEELSHPIKCMVDTGASLSVISSKLAYGKYKSLLQKETKSFEVRTGNGITNAQYYIPLTVAGNKATYLIKFYVLDIDIDWIIGRKVIYALKQDKQNEITNNIHYRKRHNELTQQYVHKATPYDHDKEDSDDEIEMDHPDFEWDLKTITDPKLLMSVKMTLAQYATTFASGEWDIGNVEGIELTIPTWSNKPINCAPYQLSPEQAAEVQRQCENMLKHGVIAYSQRKNHENL